MQQIPTLKKKCVSRVPAFRAQFLRSLTAYPQHHYPLFFLKTGPPGAGKSTANRVLYKAFHLKKKDDVVNINVDDLVQEFTPFLCESNQTSSADERKRLYFKYRNEVNDLLEAKMFAAISMRLNIEFETLGSTGALAWLKTLFQVLHKSSYTIVLVFTSVTKTTLLKRLRQRNRKQNRFVDTSFALSAWKETRENTNRLMKFVDQYVEIDNNTNNQPQIIKHQRRLSPNANRIL
jgi:predicted ABC-type ATPase